MPISRADLTIDLKAAGDDALSSREKASGGGSRRRPIARSRVLFPNRDGRPFDLCSAPKQVKIYVLEPAELPALSHEIVGKVPKSTPCSVLKCAMYENEDFRTQLVGHSCRFQDLALRPATFAWHGLRAISRAARP